MKNKEYFFILCLKNLLSENSKDQVVFTPSDDKDSIPKIILTKEKNEYIVKVFKFNNKSSKVNFEFFYDGKKYTLILDKMKDKTFLFNAEYTLQNSKKKEDQQKIDVSEKMNYFEEALKVQNEFEKLKILYNDSINLCEKKKSFPFLINIFVKIYDNELCPKLLELFNKNKTNLVENINKENLLKYKLNFEEIVKNAKDYISKFSLDPFDFYGLILCYLNICNNEKYKELFCKLSKKEESKKILFEVMLTYNLFFMKQNDISKDILNEFIKYATKKDFKTFKDDALFYLKDINTRLEIIDNNKDDIIEIKNFEPIELTIKDDEEIKFEILNPKIESIIDFSKEKKKLLINLNKNFWIILSKKSYGISRDNIELCTTIRNILKNYYNMILEIIPDNNNLIKKDVKATYKKGIFIHQIDKIIKEYIDKTEEISNREIIELIRDYDDYYKNDNYIKKRDPNILEKIKIDLDNKKNENFFNEFKEMKFEKIFKDDYKNFLIIFTKKIKKISDFDMILKLINIELLPEKSYYLNQLKNKYENAIIKISENDPHLIQSLVNLIIYICINENKNEFLENFSKKININPNIKHKIYIGIINFCKENKSEPIKNIKTFIIKHYTGSLKPEKLKEFIDFIINLSEDDANTFIESIDDKYNIIETDFYSRGIKLNIQLLNELLIKNNLNLNDDNKYKKNNIGIIDKIAKDIEEKEIQYEYLKNLVEDDKEFVIEKLNLLTLAQNTILNQDEIYDNIQKYYKEMNDDLEKLSNYKRNLEIYHSQIKKDEISKITQNIEKIQKETYVNYYNNTKSDIQTLFDECQNIVKDIEDVKNSKIFKIFYQNESTKNNSPFDTAYEEFKKFKQLIIKNGTEIINSQNNIIKKINEQYKDDITIQNELSSLIKGEQQNEEEVMIMFNKKNYEKDLNSMFDFLSYLKNKNLKKEINVWIKKCNNLSVEQDNSKIKKILDELKKEGIYDYNKNKETKLNYIQFFNLFLENKQALEFLDQHIPEDIKPLYEKIFPGSDLTINNIRDTLNCVSFFQELKKIDGTLKEIIEHINLRLSENESSIFNGFIRYLEIYRGVIELNENFDFAQSIYIEIKEIIHDSKFMFNKNYDELNVIESRDNGVPNSIKIISLDKIRELKTKIHINQEIKKDSSDEANSDNYKRRYEELKFFKDLIVNIEEIHEFMKVLRTKGSTLPISICVDILYPKVNYLLDGKKKDFKDIYVFLSKAKINIINKLDLIYKNMTTIRFLYGKQIDSILNHIQGSYKINSFLRYILNLTDPKEVKEGRKAFVRKSMDYINEINNYNNDSFNIIHDYIINLFDENGTSIEKHYKKISIKEGNDLKGICTYFSKSDSLEEDILQIYLDKVGKIPIAQNILINSKETSYEEMQAFFHRAILCQYNTLFVVELNGSFSPFQQRCMNLFIDKILTIKKDEFNRKNVDNIVEKSNTSSYMESCLVFIYNKKDDSFLNELKKFNPKKLELNYIFSNFGQPRQSICSSSTIFEPKKDELYKNTHIIQSEICGLGKSTQIKNNIKKSGKQYIYFPLGGNINKDIIYHKLNNIMNDINIKTKNNYEDIAIHLDLFESKENIVSVLNEFLFSFLITKFYSNNENIIFIPINIEIYIEIPNSFKDFISNYGIIKYFKKNDDMITIDSLPDLNLPEDKINLFKNMLNKNNNKDIYEWIKEKFDKIKLTRYSYHQIHIFINLFICQYNIFEGRKIYFREGEKDVTDKCIDSFAEATKYFTYGGFSKLLLEEKKNNKETNNDEIDILSKEYDNDLKNENFDKNLIFIVKNKDGKFGDKLGIFYKLNISTDALENGNALGKLKEDQIEDRRKKKEKMPLEMFTKLEYLEIFKKILDLDNSVEPEGEKLISLLEIIDKDDYVITTDNFRKMILILYRIIANIPVILMGETGCGKTALVKKLSQLLNNGKEILESINIDPSYDDEKLTKKMNEINKKAKESEGELWVFFDELNTCDSLSLITEIFINRTYGRKELEKNIRLIGACNPYRKKKENKNICGLTYKNDDDNEEKLVYLVNILPQSLMYYVFNFGSLEKENENQYISSIISDIIPDQKLKEATKNVISECHDYLRETFDPSVVSLRELRRFKKIYKFLFQYFEKKNELDPTKKGTEESINVKSIIISIYLCYYIRLVDETTRSNFDAKMLDVFKQLANYNFEASSNEGDTKNTNITDIIYDGYLKNDLKFNYGIEDFNQFQFKQILSKEEDFIINNINLNKGLGKNKSLKENIFILFLALVTNIPLIIIGKPGSSKSLSAQLIYKEMSGKCSTKKFFTYYPSIIQTYFQGSDSTTPKDVEDLFKKAEGRLKGLRGNKSELPILMILFDELGLAERSKHNPLKALHCNLEIDGNDKKGKETGISFIGISNWTLDAAKINRALNLSVPDLDSNLDDLKLTSISISESINDSFGTNSIFNKILPNVYFNFKENLKILKKLTVYKQYEIQEYKNLIDTFKDDEEFQNIFWDIEECKIFFEKREQKDKELKTNELGKEAKIYDYDIFKKKKQKLKEFCEAKNDKMKDKKDYYTQKSLLNNKYYKNLYEKDKKVKVDFLGNRDFYYIIKGIANEMNDNNLDYKVIIKKYIERNFGGYEIIIDFENDYDDLKEFEKYNKDEYKEFFNKILERPKWTSVQIFEIVFNIYCNQNDEPDSLIDETSLDEFKYMENIINNIKDIKSRYLLLGINSTHASLIHQKIEKELKKNIYFYEGSPFPNDNNKEYQFNIINKIQVHAENGDIIILHNLNQVYAFLYDLFNKNFIIKDGKQYARICIGNYSEIHTPINKGFRVIVMVNKKYLNKIEPPFLNRFEKMIISFSQLIDQNKKNLAEIINSELDMKICENKYKINYRLKNLLIGCHIEYIIGMIYYESDSTEKSTKNENDKIKENINNKIVKLLPQDIIVNLDNNALRDLYYKKKQYYNLEQYLNSKPTHKISIIYTFSNIINVDYDTLSFKMISEIKSENQLLNNINDMITERANNKNINKKKINDNKNKNFIFIELDESNSECIGFLISFVFNNYDKNEELKFIFIVHTKRNFKVDPISEKIFAVIDINPRIYQLFIDNLNGPEIKLKEIISNPINELKEKGLINIEEELDDALIKFTNDNLKNNFYGENDKFNEDNYLTMLKELFSENKYQDLKNCIIEKIDSYINNQNEDSNNSNGIILKIYQKGYIDKNTVDLISTINEFVKKEIISKNINIILSYLEDNNVLTSLLVLNNDKKLINDELQETVKEMVMQYLEKINMEKNNYKPKFIFSFIIPCFIEFYANLSDYIINDIRNDFFKNEKMLRNFSSNKKKVSDTKDNYDTKEKYLFSLVYKKLEENKFYFEFIQKIPSDLILNDYITYFLIKYCSYYGDLENTVNYYNLSYDDDKHKLLNILLDLKFGVRNENIQIELLLKKIIWILGNKDYIKKILNIYDILKKIFDENTYISIIERTLKEQNLRYITHEKKNPIITTEVNECFYKIIATFCYSIIPPYIDFNKKIRTINYIDQLTSAMKIIKGLNDELKIFSIEVDLIDELIQIYDILSINGKLEGDKLEEICMILKNNNLILQKNEKIQSEDLVGEFKSLISAINKSLTDNDKNYYELLKFIFYKEIKKVPDVRYRAAIFQEVIKDAEVIVNSNDIFQILLFPIVKPKKNIFPKSIPEILNATDYDVAIIIENILSDNENRDYKIYNAINETLLYYFEKNSLMYFNELFHEKEKILFDNDDDEDKDKKAKDEDKKEVKIIGPLKLFNKCVKYLLDYKKGNKKLDEKNKNICKLFCLGYIRVYCYKFIELIDSDSPNLGDISKIIKEINNCKELTKNISFYIWKVIYNKNQKNIDIFINPEYISKYRLKEYDCFKNFEIKENPFSYACLNAQDKDIYEKYNQILGKYLENQFEDINLEEFKIIKKDIDLFYNLTSISILSRLKKRQFINQSIYQNFFNNVCIPLFKNDDRIFSAIKILYDPKKYDKLQKELGITSENLNIILHSYRYFINQLYSNSQNNVYSLLYGKRLDQAKFKNSLFPGNDIKNIPIYSIYSNIVDHFKNIPNQGCFVCLCKGGGYYHSIKGVIPSEKYKNLKCKSCGEPIGAFMNKRGVYAPIKRDNYYRILKTEEEAEYDAERYREKYNSMSLESFKENYILSELKKERGIQKSDEDFFLKDSKIIRSLSQISYRILNYILYSHLLFYKIYNETKSFDIYLPKKMSWIQVISECWRMIKYELNKLGINSIDLFMNYIFPDLFSALNKHKSINEYNELDEFEKTLDILIQNKINSFIKNYKSLSKSINSQFSFQDFLEEKYEDYDNNEYPFYNYFYYSDYINEAYLFNQIKSKKDKYPVLFKVLENNANNSNINQYSLDHLPNYNKVLNLFNETYFYSIKREKANNLQLKDLKDDEIYLNNRNEIKTFMNFYNNLKLKDSKNQDMKLSDQSLLADFFIDDNNEFGKSYKKIYNEFIKEQNAEITNLLDIKIEQDVFERDCKDKINIQSANSNEVFITTFSEKFSFDEVIFNSSYRKIALDRNYTSYNQFEVDLNLIEDDMTVKLLKNKKLFNDSIINFVYSNEKLEFENKNIITEFNQLYNIEKLNFKNKLILYKFYQDNKEKNQDFFLTILNDFNQLIIILNNNKKLLNEKNINKAINLKDDSRISEVLEKSTKVSEEFKKLFKDNESLIINKTTYLFEYYRDIIFPRIKNELKAFQINLETEQEEKINNYFKKQTIINEKIFKAAIRAFIVLYLNFEKDKENNIKQNENNIINYLNIIDIWDITTYSKENFKEELNNLKQLKIKMNQIISLYDFLVDDINIKYFEDVQKELDKEKESKNIIEKEKVLVEETSENLPDNKEEDEESSYYNDKEESEESEDPDAKYI